MNASDVITALEIPAVSRVDLRISKRLLLEFASPTATDKRHLTDGIEELLWVAALKPTTIAVPIFRDDCREYLEIQVLHLILRSDTKAARIVELLHRAIPYPTLLVTDQSSRVGFSTAHLRGSQAEERKTVLDGDVVAVQYNETQDGQWRTPFLAALTLRRQPRANLRELYQGWIDTLRSLEAARLSGAFGVAESPDRAEQRSAALEECARLEAEAARLRAAAAKEKQMKRRVEINMQLQRVEAQRTAALAKL